MTIGKIDVTEAVKKIEKLLAEDKNISSELRATIKVLLVIINLLVNKLGLNSNNSSKPPSSDPHRQRGTKKKTKGKKRKPGGQRRHKGTNLKKVENPDQVELLEIDRTTLPPGDYSEAGYDSRQVIDIEITRHVIEYRAEILEDENGDQYVAEFPDGVTRPVQYGTELKAQSVYMSQQQLIPYNRIVDYFSDQCGIPISSGSLVNFNKQAYDLLEDFESKVKQQLISSELLHVDETGININGKNLWLHSCSNAYWTMYYPHKKRGLEAMNEMGVLEHFHGILCHDHWKPYFRFECTHALCNAHYLRELERAYEQDEQQWAKKLQNLLLEINKEVDKSGGCLAEDKAESYRKRYRRILLKGELECPQPLEDEEKPKRGRIKKSKSRNLLERLRDFETEVLLFMIDNRVPFTNNQGENDIRMTKVQQKISGCFRSTVGAKYFCRIRGYLSTCRKHGMKATDALRILFSGNLPNFVH